MFIRMTSNSIINTSVVTGISYNEDMKTVTLCIPRGTVKQQSWDTMDKVTGDRLIDAIWDSMTKGDTHFCIKTWLKHNADGLALAT